MIVEIETPQDFSFVETLNAHGWRRLAPFDCDDASATLKRAERMQDGSVVRLTIRAEAERIVVESPDSADADEIERRVRLMFQLHIPVERFHAYCRASASLEQIAAMRQGRMLCSPTIWEDCCKVILTTNTTWAQTVSMTRRLVETYGSSHPSQPESRAFPEPHQVAAAPFEQFERAARFGYRNLAIHNLACAIDSGEMNLEAYRDPAVSSADLWRRLLAVRGVGPYAASCLMIYLGRYERVNVDSWARMMVSRELERTVTDRDVHNFFAPHGEWSGLVYHFYPWKTVEPVY